MKEDAEEGGNKTKNVNDTTETKLAGSKMSQSNEENETTMETAADAAPEPALPKSDYSLMDSLCQFLYSDEEPLSILCGYFLKIMSQLLDKQKMATLEYLLIHQEGKIFNGLLRHIDQHSIASLL